MEIKLYNVPTGMIQFGDSLYCRLESTNRYHSNCITVTSQKKWRFVLSSMEKVSWSVLCLDFSCVANCYLHKGKKEECVSNLVCLIIAQPKILKSGPCRLKALYLLLNIICIYYF